MTPPDVKAPGSIAASQAQGQSTEDADIVAAHDAGRKPTETRTATAALAGIQAHKLATGGWLVSRWNLCRELADDAEFDRWLGQVSGARV